MTCAGGLSVGGSPQSRAGPRGPRGAQGVPSTPAQSAPRTGWGWGNRGLLPSGSNLVSGEWAAGELATPLEGSIGFPSVL